MSPFALPQVLGQELQSFRVSNFGGGLDVTTPPKVLAEMGAKNTWLTQATNVIIEPGGSIRKRGGMLLSHEDSETELDNTKVLGGYEYRTSNGTSRNVVATSGGIVYHLDAATGLFTSIKTGLTNTTRPYSFATYNDILHVANGTDAPQQWDGTTWAALGGSSPATAAVLVAHANRMFATATAVPSRLYWSKLNASTDWSGTTDAGFLDVNPNDGSTLLALTSSIQELVMLKGNRPYRLQGIGPTTGYTVVDNMVPAVGSTGAASSRGATFAGNTVYYVSNSGVHSLVATQQFGDLTESYVSRPVERYFQSRHAIAGFSPFLDAGDGYAATRRMIQYVPGENYLVVAGRTGTGGTYPETLLIYDLGTRAWTVWTLPTNAQVTAMWTTAGTSAIAPSGWLNLALHSTSTDDSGVMLMYRGLTGNVDVGDNMASAAISAQVRHVSHLGAPGVEKSPRILYLYFAKESATTTMTLNLYADFKTTAVFTTTFDITSSTAETVVVKRINLSSIACEYLEVDLTQATAGKSFTFYGYEVKFRTRRTIRRAE